MWIGNNLILSREDVRTYLYSLGLDRFEIDDLFEIIVNSNNGIVWKEESKAWEQDSAEQFEKRNGLICDVQEVAERLRQGKGTKAKIADELDRLCEYWY